MRYSIVACALAIASAGSVGCGASPAAKDPSDVASRGPAGGGDDKAAAPGHDQGAPKEAGASGSTGADATAKAPASASAASAEGDAPAAPAASSSSGTDIKVDGDDPWLASHEMPPKDIIKTMHASEGKVKACYREGLKRDPSVTGEVKIRFVVTNDGAVRAWKDDTSSMTDGDVTKCVGEVINKLKFPKQKSPGDAWGRYSINFAP